MENVSAAYQEKDRLLTVVLQVVSILGAAAYIPGVWLALVNGIPAIAATNTAAYGAILFVAWRRSTPLGVKLVVLAIACLVVATVLLFAVGVLGAAYIWFAAALAFPAIFAGRKAIILFYSSTAAVLAVYVLALHLGHDGHGGTIPVVRVNGASLLVVSGALGLIIRTLLRRLEGALQNLDEELTAGEETRRHLQEALVAREALLREVHHRVNNNMQLVLSLIHLEGLDDTEPAVRHIRVLAAVNEVLHRETTTMNAGALEVVRAVCTVLGTASGAVVLQPRESDARVSSQVAIPLALYLHDVLVALLERKIPVVVRGGENPDTLLELYLHDPEGHRGELPGAFAATAGGVGAAVAAAVVAARASHDPPGIVFTYRQANQQK